MPCKQPGSGTCSCCRGQYEGGLSRSDCQKNCLSGGNQCQIGHMGCGFASTSCSAKCGGTLASINAPGPKRDFRSSWMGVK
jgi:hypothetical protein